MDDLLNEVLDLQSAWTQADTPEMNRRGVLVRRELKRYLEDFSAEFSAALNIEPGDLKIEGKDATGRKSEIPWIRICSRTLSPNPTKGWYVVYLFSALGDRVYLSLIQGTTWWDGTAFVPRKQEELAARVSWARRIVASHRVESAALLERIDLQARRTNLGAAYEAGNVVAIGYEHNAIPGPAALARDLRLMIGLLAQVYREEAAVPGLAEELVPEVIEVTQASSRAANRRTGLAGGQGFELTVEERRAVERHSVKLASQYFADQGWTVDDVGDRESFDLLLKRGGNRLYVEVKGTTALGGRVVLTRAEVECQRNFAPDNALVVVHSIELDRLHNPPVADGGQLECISPWTIDDVDLSVVSYVYKTGL